ncbi:MAG: hypothetical protein MUQ10_08130, partial [Anaerolineae bacterium]|nr:hypothetical protein [Anaerolineae bacterium]
ESQGACQFRPRRGAVIEICSALLRVIPPDQPIAHDAARSMPWSGASAAGVEGVLDVSRAVAREDICGVIST